MVVRASSREEVNEAVSHAVLGALEDIEDLVAERMFTRWTEAFVAKSEGGEDEFGNSWPPLSERTIRDKERNPPNLSHRNSLGARMIRDLVSQGMTKQEALSKAVSVLGQNFTENSHVINVRHGDLIASLSPDGHENQIREKEDNLIILGTEDPKAGYVNAQRRFLPTGDEAVEWLYDVAVELRDQIATDIVAGMRLG